MSLQTRCVRRCAAGLVLLLALPAQAQCPSQDARVVLERFVPADCAACWRDAPAPAGAPAVLDWIVPSPRGDEAPLSAAALAEATARAGAPAADATLQRRHFLKPQRSLRVGVLDGPAWNGYIGLQLRVQQRDAALPRGAVAYLALVENVDAGDEGTPVARRLVRALVGPLPLDAASPANEHLRAVRLPMGVRLDRLGSVGWVENASGQMLAWATATSDDCTR